MRIGSLFSGIGGLELGLEWAGVGHTVFQVEQDPYCLAVLAKHWPDAQRFTDVREVGAHNLPIADVLCGGFPCQDISTAGRGAGLAGARSGLWSEFARIVGECGPRYVVVENVAQGKRRWVCAVQRALRELGYRVPRPLQIAAADVGAWHIRERLFVLAYTDGEPLRKQPGWGERSRRSRAPLSAIASEERHAPHADALWQLQPEGSQPDIRRRAGDRGWWAVEPDVARVVHGLPARVDRERALGNSVVPQVAEVVGRRLMQFAEAA